MKIFLNNHFLHTKVLFHHLSINFLPSSLCIFPCMQNGLFLLYFLVHMLHFCCHCHIYLVWIIHFFIQLDNKSFCSKFPFILFLLFFLYCCCCHCSIIFHPLVIRFLQLSSVAKIENDPHSLVPCYSFFHFFFLPSSLLYFSSTFFTIKSGTCLPQEGDRYCHHHSYLKLS